MDVLDDLAGEAGEVAEGGNEWLTYGAPLHRLREWGTARKVRRERQSEELTERVVRLTNGGLVARKGGKE